MPRVPRLTTRLVKQQEARVALGCKARTFWRRWALVFTDPRPPADRRKGCERKMYEDELSIAVERSNQGPAAVLMRRRLMRRRLMGRGGMPTDAVVDDDGGHAGDPGVSAARCR